MGKQDNKLLALLALSTRLKLWLIAAAVVLLIIAGVVVVWLNRDNHVAVETDERTVLSPTLVQSMKDIGEWEFLTISDEEIIDTVRHGFFGDDQLVRIYYGTLRLGIDMQQVEDNWIGMDKDTVVVKLPDVALLDDDFIDEARTRSFFEEGKWTQQDRQKLYLKAHAAMQRRCLTPKNLETARKNAREQITALLHSLGFPYVRIE